MRVEETRLLLRGRDLNVLARKPVLGPTDLRMLIGFAQDVMRDADVLIAQHRVLPPTVEPVLGLLRAVVVLAGEAGRIPSRRPEV